MCIQSRDVELNTVTRSKYPADPKSQRSDRFKSILSTRHWSPTSRPRGLNYPSSNPFRQPTEVFRLQVSAVHQQNGAPIVLVPDAPAERLVQRSVRLYLIPLPAGQEPFLLVVFVVVVFLVRHGHFLVIRKRDADLGKQKQTNEIITHTFFLPPPRMGHKNHVWSTRRGKVRSD